MSLACGGGIDNFSDAARARVIDLPRHRYDTRTGKVRSLERDRDVSPSGKVIVGTEPLLLFFLFLFFSFY